MTIELDKPEVSNLYILIYGEGGLGKTSLVLTATNPILLLFNKGGDQRTSSPIPALVNLHNQSPVQNWEKLMKTINDPGMKKFNTLITDTWGDLIEMMIDYLYEKDPTLFEAVSRPNEKGWGEIKKHSKEIIKVLEAHNRDIIVVAHNNYVKKNKSDDYKSYPDIIGGSKKIFERGFDLVGYITVKDDKRFLSFNHSEEAMGKNCIELPIYEIPDHHSEEYGTFMAEVIADVKKKLKQRIKQNTKSFEISSQIKLEIANAKEPHELDAIRDKIAGIKKTPHVRKILNVDLYAKAEKLGLTYNTRLGSFVVPDKEAAQEKQEQGAKGQADDTAKDIVDKIEK